MNKEDFLNSKGWKLYTIGDPRFYFEKRWSKKLKNGSFVVCSEEAAINIEKTLSKKKK